MQSQDLREALRVLIRRLGVLQKSEATCCGVTLSQCHALIEVERKGELTLNQLADSLNLDKSTMSRNVDNLVNTGYMIRESAQDDRRTVVIRLSECGRSLVSGINTGMDDYYQTLLAVIAPHKQEIIAEGLDLLIQAIQQVDQGCEKSVKGGR